MKSISNSGFKRLARLIRSQDGLMDYFKDNLGVTRPYFLASNCATEVSSLIPELQEGSNELTQEEADSYSEQLATNAGSGLTGKKRLQEAKILWDLFHGPYDERPSWF